MLEEGAGETAVYTILKGWGGVSFTHRSRTKKTFKNNVGKQIQKNMDMEYAAAPKYKKQI